MNNKSKYIWVSANPSLKNFHRPLIGLLSHQFEIEFWEYYQTPDENCSIAGAVDLLRVYLLSLPDRSINLIGHGMGGVIALEYARTYPQAIDSVVLLSVAAQPAITWQYYYYQQLRLGRFGRADAPRTSRQCLLRSVAASLLPAGSCQQVRDLVGKLDRDLLEAPSEHSPWLLTDLPQGNISPFVAIFQSEDDIITNTSLSGEWEDQLDRGDLFVKLGSGGHFFHYFHPHAIANQISNFWLDDRYNLDFTPQIDRDRYPVNHIKGL